MEPLEKAKIRKLEGGEAIQVAAPDESAVGSPEKGDVPRRDTEEQKASQPSRTFPGGKCSKSLEGADKGQPARAGWAYALLVCGHRPLLRDDCRILLLHGEGPVALLADSDPVAKATADIQVRVFCACQSSRT